MLPKVQKILNDLPEEEVKNITNTAFEEFNKNPDQFIQCLKQGNYGSLLMTPKLATTLKVAGVSWFAFNMLMTYVVECWLADMQLKAGRLGVMKALDSLKDPAYYANSEPDKQQK